MRYKYKFRKIKIILAIFLTIFFFGCCSIEATPSPPELFEPGRPTNDKELLKEWQRSLMKIKEYELLRTLFS